MFRMRYPCPMGMLFLFITGNYSFYLFSSFVKIKETGYVSNYNYEISKKKRNVKLESPLMYFFPDLL